MGGCCSPDNLDLYVDGVLLLSMTTNNALGTVVDFGGGTLWSMTARSMVPSFSPTTLVDMATASRLSFAHTGSSLTMFITPSGRVGRVGPTKVGRTGFALAFR